MSDAIRVISDWPYGDDFIDALVRRLRLRRALDELQQFEHLRQIVYCDAERSPFASA